MTIYHFKFIQLPVIRKVCEKEQPAQELPKKLLDNYLPKTFQHMC